MNSKQNAQRSIIKPVTRKNRFLLPAVLGLLVWAANAGAQSYTVLTNFSGTNGSQPMGGLAFADNALFGTTYSGGASNRGTLFKLSSDGSGFVTLKDFTGDDGANPLGTLTFAGGALYGTTYQGGHTNTFYSSPSGTVFKLSPDGSGFKTLKTFNHLNKGANPRGGLLVTNRFIFGTTEHGGRDDGTVFKMRTNGGQFRIIKRFNPSEIRGSIPNPSLVTDGQQLYGTTETGGRDGYGTVFSMHMGGGGHQIIKDFGLGIPARTPSDGLVLSGRDNLLYGTTELGGGLSSQGKFFSVRGFSRRNSGGLTLTGNLPQANPGVTRLVLSGNYLYGTTAVGGALGYGTIFRVRIDGSDYTVLYDFDNVHGANPRGDLLLSGGVLYGTTSSGGSSGNGVVFRFSFGPAPPAITDQPDNVAVARNAAASFSVTADGTGPLGYQWWKNGRPVGGQTAPSYNVSSAQTADVGAYFVIITNAFGSATSTVATLTLLSTNFPNITSEPTSIVARVSGAASFSVSATGQGPLHYQWYFEDAPIGGATAATYSILNAQTNQEGDYFVVITNTSGSVTSTVAALTVLNEPLIITAEPEDTTNRVGTAGGFSVSVDGATPLHYQWYFQAAPILGATNAAYTIASVSTSNAGDYLAVIYNGSGSVTSEVATLTVLLTNAPAITSQPQSRTNNIGTAASFGVTATGDAPLKYQWLKNGTPIGGANTNTYTISSVVTNDAGGYSVVITNLSGSVTSVVATLTVVNPNAPAITSQPQSRTNFFGENATFSVTATGTAPLVYQWLKTGASLTGRTNATLTITNVQPADAAGYSVIVTNASGSVTSVVATLTVVDPNAPAITGQPQSVTVAVSSNISLTVTATGLAPLSYQWVKDGAPISGASGASFNVANIQLASQGAYWVVVTNTHGSATSDVALVTVLVTPPNIVTQPQNIVSLVNTSATFTVTAGGGAPLSYQWFFEDTPIAGATGSTYTIPNVQTNHDGGYSVVITNVSGAVTSVVASLTVFAIPLEITLQPQDITNTMGVPATFTVTADGIDPISYQWWKDGVLLNGANDDKLDITSVDTSDAGGYYVVVSNAYTSVTSSVATLTVLLTVPVDYVWTSPVSGDWSQESNWSPLGGPPGPADSATINLSVTVTVDDSTTVSNLNLTNARLTSELPEDQLAIRGTMNWMGGQVDAPLLVKSNGVVNWSSGYLDGALTVAAGGTLAISNTVLIGYYNFNYYGLSNFVTLTNYGTVLWAGNSISGYGQGLIYNAGLWQDLGDQSLDVATGTNLLFINTGTVQKTGGTGTASINWTFNTTGTVNTPSGSLTIPKWTGTSTLHGAMNLGGGVLNAPLTVSSNAVLNWLGGYLDNALTVAAGGTLNISNTLVIGYYNLNYYGLTNFVALTNNGTVLMGSSITGYGQSLIYNAGLWQELSDHSLDVAGTNLLFVNVGTFQKIGGTGSTSLNWPFNTTGTVNTPSGSLIIPRWIGTSVLHGTMNLAGGIMNAPVTVANSAVLNWSGGYLDSSLTVAPGGTLSISNTVFMGYQNLNYYGSTNFVVLTNNGTVFWAGNEIDGYGQALIYNAGLWQEFGDQSLYASASTNLLFINVGTLQKVGGTGTSSINWLFNTTGTVNAPTGSLLVNWTGASRLHGALNWSGGTLNGALTLADDAVMNWSAGTMAGSMTVDSNAVLNWSGGYLDGALTVAPGATLSLSNTVVFGYFNFNYYGLTNFVALTNYGTLWAGAGSSIAGYGQALIYNAGLWQDFGDQSLDIGAGTNLFFVNTGTFQKTGGTGSATINWPFNTTGTINTTSGSMTVPKWTGISTLHGTMNLGGGVMNAPLLVASNAVLNWLGGYLDNLLTIAPGGTLDISNSLVIGYYNLNYYGMTNFVALTNNGTVLWGGSPISGYSQALIYNAGLWQDLGDHTMDVGTGTNVYFVNVGTFQKTGGTGSTSLNWTFNTVGTVNTPSGSLIIPKWLGTSTLHGTMNLAGGIINAPLTVANNGVLNWLGGYLDNSLTIAPGGTLNISSALFIGYYNLNTYGLANFVALTNNGTVLWGGSPISGYGQALIYNAGLWQESGDHTMDVGTGTNVFFVNAGTFQKNGGVGSTSINWPFNTAGNVNVQTGTLALSQTAVQTAGLTSLNGGNLSVSQPFQLLGGVLAGTNSIFGSVSNSGGLLSPGLATGQLHINGDYTQTAGGALQIDLAGTAQGTTYDLLSVNNTVQLNGQLRIGLGAGFIPATNTTYTFLTAGARSGVFSSLIYPTNILGFTLTYDAGSVSLQVTNVQSPPSPTTVVMPDINGTNFSACFGGESGATYTIECSTNLSSGWMKLTNVMGSFTSDGCGVGGVQLQDFLRAAPERFYRVAYPAY